MHQERKQNACPRKQGRFIILISSRHWNLTLSFFETVRMSRTAHLRAGSLLGIVFLICSLARAQAPEGTLQGRVFNGTTGRPVANLQVNYILMQQGMEPVATAVTDGDGRFLLEGTGASGGAPALLRTVFQGVTYSQAVFPQQVQPDGVQIEVFEAGNRSDLFSVKEHLIFLHPAGDAIFVTEQVVLENGSAPPKTYFNPEGTYRFALSEPPRADIRLSVTGPGGMPINQAVVPGEQDNSFAITYPVRPGETQVRIDYSFGYQSPFDFTKLLLLPAGQIYVVSPGPEVQITGPGVTELGTDPSTGFIGYQVTPEENLIRVEVSGQAPATTVGAGGQQGAESGALLPIPAPVNNRRWLILAVLGIAMLLGFVYHYTR